jgi:hypothetical protein
MQIKNGVIEWFKINLIFLMRLREVMHLRSSGLAVVTLEFQPMRLSESLQVALTPYNHLAFYYHFTVRLILISCSLHIYSIPSTSCYLTVLLTIYRTGSVFVHRNIANMVVNTDFNCMSVIQFAVSVLKVKHIIVCGHYDCGGIKASLETADYSSPLCNWLRNVRDTYRLHREELNAIEDFRLRSRRLVELNVIEQVNLMILFKLKCIHYYHLFNQLLKVNMDAILVSC